MRSVECILGVYKILDISRTHSPLDALKLDPGTDYAQLEEGIFFQGFTRHELEILESKRFKFDSEKGIIIPKADLEHLARFEAFSLYDPPNPERFLQPYLGRIIEFGKITNATAVYVYEQINEHKRTKS
ncbi:MAG TPA: hypothetical protein VJI68_00285 [Candidatus Nanoarchaeia archaeon]|nr:hypothetical protein [Candidatus Nanoarchaeia archaeon]